MCIRDRMGAYLDKGEGKDIVQKVQAVLGFEIVKEKKGPVIKHWVIDLKNGQGRIFEGKVEGIDATFNMQDEDFEAVCQGKLNPQVAFTQGKMRIRGNMKKASLFTPDLFPPPTPENIAKYLKPKLQKQHKHIQYTCRHAQRAFT
eukprot:TRINITY_DN4611_c0_g1_i1.p3 TRINITY_DN4611_c0_g1~~TRINITY_DN4611_c0_g1_i1.p3  ORF type:complete len:145 (+),score=39.60 TRINITY_DN4611_c0_g1_i1:121-555(+)